MSLVYPIRGFTAFIRPFRSTSKFHQSITGFTIVELMIATAVFSMLLLLISSSAISIGNMYQRGVVSTRTQEAGRDIMESIQRDIQFGQGAPVPGSPLSPDTNGFTVNAFCVGDIRYSYILNAEVVDSPPYFTNNRTPHALWRDNFTGVCKAADLGINTNDPSWSNGGVQGSGKELMPASMRLRPNTALSNGLSVASVNGSTGRLYKVDLLIIYGDNAVINPSGSCYAITQGGTFCSLSEQHAEVYHDPKY